MQLRGKPLRIELSTNHQNHQHPGRRDRSARGRATETAARLGRGPRHGTQTFEEGQDTYRARARGGRPAGGSGRGGIGRGGDGEAGTARGARHIFA